MAVRPFNRPLLRRAVAAVAGALAVSALWRRVPSCGAWSPPRVEALDALRFHHERKYPGQLTPWLPEGDVAAGITVEHDSVLWQRGPYQSWWLRLGVGRRPMPSHMELSSALDVVLARAGAEPAPGAAAFVGVHELAVEPQVLGLLRARGFRYHHYQAPAASGARCEQHPGEFIYYRWMGDAAHDMVPSYATSIEGIAALMLSPDEKKVLLIWEYGNWKAVTGAVDQAESSLVALRRELREEVSGELDPSFTPRYLGGWQMSAARDGIVNDNFASYVVRATSENIQVDGNEVAAARWFDCDELLAVWRKAGSPGPASGSQLKLDERMASAHPGLVDLTELGRAAISINALVWLDGHRRGASLPVQVWERASNTSPTPSQRTFIGGTGA